jgi:hypothetical protein
MSPRDARGEVITPASVTQREQALVLDVVPRVELLGAFEVFCAGEEVQLPKPAQRLLAFLALQERPVVRVHAGILWLDATEHHAFGSLRSALWSIRHATEGLVEAERDQLRLGSHVAVDVRELLDCARRISDASAQLAPDDSERVSHAGDLLPDWYDDWVLIERELVRLIRVHALETLCERLTAMAMGHADHPTPGRYRHQLEGQLADDAALLNAYLSLAGAQTWRAPGRSRVVERELTGLQTREPA